MTITTLRNFGRTSVIVMASALALTGCSAAAPSAEQGPAADSVQMSNAWIKAADEGMSAAFGELVNSGSEDVTIVSATTDAATMVELHETVENSAGVMTMREIDGGFVIPAEGSLTLEPGADHIMLMGLTGAIASGEEVSFTLTFSDDSTYEFTAPVKDYAGANETYEDDMSDMDHSDMDGSDMDGEE